MEAKHPAASKIKLIPSFIDSDESNPMCLIDVQLEKMLLWAQSEFGNEELIRAKEEFFWKNGKVFYDDSFYEKRMGYFIDYFLLERPIKSHETGDLASPFNVFRANQDSSEVDFEHEDSLDSAVHSIFQIQKVNDTSLALYDLLHEEKIVVSAREGESFKALNRKEIFQGFIYRSLKGAFLSPGLVFHPVKSHRVIKKIIKRAKNSEEFEPNRELARLACLNLRHLRHAHVDPRRIYTEASA